MTLANQITLARLALVPVFVVLILRYDASGREGERIAALGVFALASIGDAVDGYVARHFNQRTKLGAILDPLADKLLLTAALAVLCFGSHGHLQAVSAWVLFSIIGRDVVILIGLGLVRSRAGLVKIQAHITGKLATALLMILVVWILLELPSAPVPYLEVVTIIFTIASCVFYVLDGVRQFYSHRAA